MADVDGERLTEGGHASEYPEPSTSEQGPYPTIASNGFTFSAETPSSRNETQQPANGNSSTSSISKAAARYMSLANYFTAGKKLLNEKPVEDAEDDEEDLGNDRPTKKPRLAAPAPPKSKSLADTFASYYNDSRSLPGFHGLDDSDRFENAALPYLRAQPRPTDERGRGGGRARGRGRGGWKWALKGTEHENLGKSTRSLDGGGRRGRPPGRAATTGRKARPVDPGPEYKRLQALANQAYLNGDLDAALEYASQAVTQNSEVYQSHWMIAQIHEQRGADREALFALTIGAMVKRDFSHWMELGEKHEDMAEQNNKNPSDLRLAIKCYTEALYLKKDDYDARNRKLDVCLELRDWKGARRMCKSMLKLRPHDLENVMRFAKFSDMLHESGSTEAAKEAYQRAFELHDECESIGDVDQRFTHLNIYLDLIGKLGEWAEGVRELKRLARWFLGREGETFWDSYTANDVEFDTTHDRRVYVAEYQQGRASLNLAQYGNGLPIDLRVKLGVFRQRMGIENLPEALRHFDHLFSLLDDVDEFSDLFRTVGDELRSFEQHENALRFYEPIMHQPQMRDRNFILALASCYTAVGREDEAAEWSAKLAPLLPKPQIIRPNVLSSKTVTAMAKANGHDFGRGGDLEEGSDEDSQSGLNRRVPRLLKPYRPILAEPSLAQDGLAISPEVPPTTPQSQSARDSSRNVETQRRSVPTSSTVSVDYLRILRQQKLDIDANHAVIKELWPAIDAAVDGEAIRKWMQHAIAMIEIFTNARIFYPSGDRYESRTEERKKIRTMQAINRKIQEKGDTFEDGDGFVSPSSADDDTPLDFHGIPFSEWHHVMTDLALCYARYADQERCFDILQNAMLPANVFRYHDSKLWETTLALSMHCALIFNDKEFLISTARQYDRLGNHLSGMAYQLIAATGRLGYADTFFSSNRMNKWMLEMVKILDYHSMSPELRGEFSYNTALEKRLKSRLASAGQLEDGLDAGALTMFGHMFAHSHFGSSSIPLSYFFRALALQPENLIVNLSIAATFVADAMQKHTANRQYGIAQGLSFLSRYYDLRVASGQACHVQEAEFNVARMWHWLGLTHLAVPGYEKVLELSERVQREYEDDTARHLGDEAEDFAREAAFALQSIFAAAGNMDAAMAVTEEWLVL